jgi:DNA-binding SARP family transcriptional activator/predicted ATPase
MLMGEGLRLVLLGKPQILRDGVPVTGFVYNKALALLAYLAVTKRPHSRESLAGLLWGEMPDAAAKANLRKILSVLREIAAPNVEIGRQEVGFNRDSNYWLDTEIFESKPQDPTPTSITPAEMQDRDVKLLDDAVQLYKGDFLEGFYVHDAPAFEEWVLPERERLQRKMQQALYQLAAHYTARGQYARGIDYTSRLLALEPWHEEVHQQMMRLLALSGQRSAALNQFEICRRLLADELGVEPNRDTVELHHRIARGEVIAQPAFTPLPRDWPVEATPFVGRVAELAQLHAYLAAPDSHLATVVGISGVGKTRLVLQGSAQATGVFRQGVYYVSAVALSTPEALSHAIVRVLALPLTGQRNAAAQLISHLQNREVLIVVDHLDLHPGVLQFLHDLMQQARRVRLLIASSNRLDLPGEWVLPLYGLSVPSTDDPDEVRRSEAVQLFMQAVARVCGACGLEADQLTHVARICRLVEGMPLGIELAAAWSRLLSYQEIAGEIENNYHFLARSSPGTAERHFSLTAAFDHSWSRMSEEERALFRQLSVFRGGFVREAAERVAGANLQILAALMDKCLIQRKLSGRYQTHRLLRRYGEQKLAEQPDEEANTYDRYCGYYTWFLQRQMALFNTGHGIAPLSEIADEQENLRAAWRWATSLAPSRTGSHADTAGAPHRFVAAKGAFDAMGVTMRAPVQTEVPGI